MRDWNPDHIEKQLKRLKFPSVGDETGFSHRPCWTCQRPLGGDRHALNYIGDDGEQHQEEICVDCVMYIVNGDLPEDFEP